MSAFFRHLLPFTYFWSSRLRTGNIGFHLVFEWIAVAVVVAALCADTLRESLLGALISYLAFISVYEIGYMANDFFAAKKELDGRHRGGQGTPDSWVFCWIVARILAFIGLTWWLGTQYLPSWWAFFIGLAVSFAMHNLMTDRELKSGTFTWLSWFRFMAPIMFVVPAEQLLGIAFACGMTYSAFRQFGYLDSKGLLAMPGRKRIVFRWAFFMWPLLAVPVLYPIPGAKGFVVLVTYYAVASSLGTAFLLFRDRPAVDAR